MRIDKIARGVECRMNEQFRSLVIFGILSFSEKILKIW